MRRGSQLTFMLACIVPLLFVDAAIAHFSPGTGRFISRDPYSELGSLLTRQAVGQSNRGFARIVVSNNGYEFVLNNPISWIDADGLAAQDQPATQPKPAPVNAGTYVCGDGEKNFFEEIVKTQSGNSIRANNGQEIIDALTGRCAKNECISKWVHAQHGWLPNSEYGQSVSGGFGSGQSGSGTGFYCKDPSPQPEDGGRKKGGRSLEDFKNAISSGKLKFCDPCTIYIYGCEVSNIGSFAADLSCATKCTVHAASGKASTAHSDGSPGTGRDPWRAEGGWDTYKDCKKQNDKPGLKYIDP